MIINLLLLFSCVAYFFVIYLLEDGFNRILSVEEKKHLNSTSFSVIIPFRNEEERLPQLIESITQIDYEASLTEFIFVDDDSTDNSVNILQNFIQEYCIENYVSIIKNERKTASPKKDAINTAINIAKHNWIITTDADCILPKKWFSLYNDYITLFNSKMVIGLVSYKTKNKFLEQFQLLDFLSLQKATIGSYGMNKTFLCNGANLAFRKDTFHDVGGFEGNDHIASGDDIFLMEKFKKKYQKDIGLLKHDQAIVYTFPKYSIKELINQRIRWASKTSKTNNSFAQFVGLAVLAWNLILISLPVLFIIDFLNIEMLIVFLIFKVTTDYIHLNKIIHFYNHQIKPVDLLLSTICYPFFVVWIVINSLFGTYYWKGRRFKK
ncbi:MAG: glycosyltransferase [Flavobacteriaceae bacterium]|nr:glycosyltransferase [Flavobacteriaceae bacterium]